MAKRKKVKKPSDTIREELQKHFADINSELKLIQQKAELVEDVSSEIEAIGVGLSCIEDCFDDLAQDFDEAKKELSEVTENAKELEDKVDEFEAAFQEKAATMLGILKYETDNLMDADLMELFTECLATVRPSIMIENLKTILQFKTVW